MACFLVPMVLAIVTTLIQKIAQGLAEKLKLSILNTLLWGGTILLMFEHIWHGEVVPWPPFLTSMTNSFNILIMLHEMITVGTVISAFTVVTWGVMLTIAHLMSKIITVKEMKQIEKPLMKL